MQTSKIVSSLILIILFTMSNIYSQGKFSVHVGPSFPVSEFANDDLDNEIAGGAAVGLGLGVKYNYPLGDDGIGLFGGLDFYYNSLKKDVKDDVEELYEFLGISNANYNYFKYINIPVSAGINYTYHANDKIALQGSAGLTLNFLKVTDFVIEVNNQEVTNEFGLSSNFGFKAGAGLLFDDQISVGFSYLNQGKHDVESELSGAGLSQELDSELKVSLLSLFVGYLF